MSANPGEEKLVCPYNPAHHILRSRMATHLTKCKRNYPNLKLGTCDFNVNHRVPQPELQYHHENCPDRRVNESIIYQVEDVTPNKFPIIQAAPDNEDSWDNEVTGKPYDPTKYLEENEILRRKDVESASVRKNFKIEERQRINRLGNANQNRPLPSVPNRQATSTGQSHQRNLPPTTKGSPVTENIPSEITKLLKRLDDGRGKPVIPKNP